MKVLFYCQYVLGMGHLFRSLSLLRAFNNHAVTLVAGGQPVDVIIPDHIGLKRLPALIMDEKFTRLIATEPGGDVSALRYRRKQQLFEWVDELRPDLFITELYPFGRRLFGFELDPILGAIREGRFGACKAVCSLRDVLVEKRDPLAFEDRVLDKLNNLYDLLLIHSDPAMQSLEETFGRTEAIEIPIHYTGFVTPPARPEAGPRLRTELGISANQKLVVASAGGGRTGYPLLKSVIRAVAERTNDEAIVLHVFSGPFMDADAYTDLHADLPPGVHVRRFTRRFADYLAAADLSISMAGYNTCMNLLVNPLPALLYPYSRQQEQPIRAHKLQSILPLRVLTDADLDPRRLQHHIIQMLTTPPPRQPLQLNLDGAHNSVRMLEKWLQ
jgi:predicted glycosyltransferase